jgi:hypothetical protein
VLGQAGDPRVRDYLLACYEAGECTLRDLNGLLRRDRSPALTRRLLVAWAGGRLELGDHLGTARPPGLLDLVLGKQEAAAAGGAPGPCSTRWICSAASAPPRSAPRSRAMPTRATCVSGCTSRQRSSAWVTAPRRRDSSPISTHCPPIGSRRPHASSLASRSRPRGAALAEPLAARSRGEDVDQALAAASVLLAWDPEAGFFRFLDALSAPSVRERDLAEEYLARNRSQELTWVMRRALAREGREYTRDRLRRLLDARS